MCGAYAAINNLFTDQLSSVLGVPEMENRGIRVPASTIQIIHENQGARLLSDAKWWLMLNPDGKPNYKYSTFNSRSDKLFSSNLTKGLFKQSRCVIPASGFIEGQDKKYHFLENPTGALALGGICKYYKINDEIITTASIITCPGGNPQLENIHRKSVPLILDHNDSNLIDMWLDVSMTESRAFADLLTNTITLDLVATPIAKARDLTPINQPIEIHADVQSNHTDSR
jgi:putative SOS response-associated peptidase YedK